MSDGISTIKKHIEKKSFQSLYLFCGEEKYLINQFKDMLVDALVDVNDTMNYIEYRGENIDLNSVVDFATTMPFLAEKRVVVVESEGFLKKNNEGGLESLMDELPETTVLVIIEQKPDKKTRIYKKIANEAVVAEFDTPSEQMLRAWINSKFANADIKLEANVTDLIINSGESNMLSLENEVEKMISYCIEKKTVTAEDVRLLITVKIEDKVFDMITAISAKNKGKALKLCGDLFELKVEPIKIISIIASQYLRLIKLKLGLEQNKDRATLSRITKINQYYLNNNIKICNQFTKQQLMDIVELCQASSESIKAGGIDGEVAVWLLIAKLLNE